MRPPATPDGRYWNPRIETLEPAEVRRLQEDLLQRQLAYLSAHSPFYAHKLADAGVRVEDVRTLEQLADVPFTAKSELRESQLATPPLGDHAAVSLEQVVRVHASSGTTGRPSYVGVTRRDADNWTEIVSRVFYCEGVRPSDVVVHGLGLGFFVGGLPLKDGIENIGATFVPIGTGASDRVVASIRDLGGTVLTCTPSYASYLAEYARSRAGIDPAELGLRRILVGGEPGGAIPAVRERIERDFGAVVLESLGNADLVPVYAATCDEQGGNHLIAPDHLLVELIDPESGEQLSWEDGAEGELVATHLTRECVPLLRFRTRDRVVVGTSPCACGRTSPRVRCIGRTDDLLIVNGVNVWPSAIRDVVAGLSPRTTGNFEVLLSGPPPAIAPPLRLRVEHGEVVDDGLKRELEGALRDKLIARAEVELVAPGTLPRYEMKAKLFRRLDLGEDGEG
jgi:phenylacetate-CoA ligase